MNLQRRRFALGVLGLGLTPALRAGSERQRVVIVGGGWGGLTAARELAANREFDVVLIDRSARFATLPVVNRWLVGLDDGKRLYRPLASAAGAFGYQHLQRDVTGIDRNSQRILTPDGSIAYDWLILSPGIREDWSSLGGGNAEIGEKIRKAFPSVFTADADFARSKARLERFSGGHFLMSIPPAPYRCPPAPYERAVMLAWYFKSRGLRFKLTLIEPNAPWPSYQRVFRSYFADQITYLPQTSVHQVDPDKRIASLEFDDLAFDDAILMPPQQAGEPCWQAGVIDTDSAGKATGWAAVDPFSFQSKADPRIFVIGDSVGRVSPLFGYFPKTGQMAARMGTIAVRRIVALSTGQATTPSLPESICHAQLSVDPPETAEIVASYARRGDGVLTQNIRQSRNNQPAGEADAQLDAELGLLLGHGVL